MLLTFLIILLSPLMSAAPVTYQSQSRSDNTDSMTDVSTDGLGHTQTFEPDLDTTAEKETFGDAVDLATNQSPIKERINELDKDFLDGSGNADSGHYDVDEISASDSSSTGDENIFGTDSTVDTSRISFASSEETGTSSNIPANNSDSSNNETHTLTEGVVTGASSDDKVLTTQTTQAVTHSSSVATSTVAPTAVDVAIDTAGLSKTLMELPDEVIIDALFTNLDIVQDELELCEEGLREKLMKIRSRQQKQKAMTYIDDENDEETSDDEINIVKATEKNTDDDNFFKNVDDANGYNDGDNSEETLQVREQFGKVKQEDDDKGSQETGNDENIVTASVSTNSKQQWPGTSSRQPEVSGESMVKVKVSSISSNNNSGRSSSNNNSSTSNTKSSSSSTNNINYRAFLTHTSLDTSERVAHVVVNRLTQRLEDLKQSLIQCYFMNNRL